MRYIVSGGGTGGHIYPALSIIKEIINRDKKAQILYIGTSHGLESKLVPREGIEFKAIRVKAMPRKINRDLFVSLKELLMGLKEARKIIKDFKPDIVIGTGGFVCGPVVYQAKRLKIPTLIHEQNAFPGITNKILARFVDKIAVTFSESIKYFKNPEKIVITGNPIRKEILQIEKNNAYKKLNVSKDLPLILSFGGSGGQKKLNESILELIKDGLIGKDFQILHITGERFYEGFIEEVKDIDLNKNIRILPYLYDMPEALNIASLVITSSGAITLAEISALGIASILIPKPYTAENHQEYNARVFEENKASKLILEKDLNGSILIEAINNIINDKFKLSQMKENSLKLGKLDAAEQIYSIIQGIRLK